MTSTEPTNQIIIFNVPNSVPQENLTATIKQIVPDAVIQTCIPLYIRPISTERERLANYQLTFKDESSARQVVEKKMLKIDGREYRVEFYYLDRYKSLDAATILVVSGFTGSDDELKNTLKEGTSIKYIDALDENTKIVVFETSSAAKSNIENPELQGKQFHIKQATKEDIQSISQKRKSQTDAPQLLEDDPRNICIKGKVVSRLTEELIKQLLEPFDSQPKIIIRSPKFDYGHRMAFVTLSSEESASKAIEALNEKPLPENILSIITQQQSHNEQDFDRIKDSKLIVEHIQKDKTTETAHSSREISRGETDVHFHLLGYNPDPRQEMLEDFLTNQAKVIVKNLNFSARRSENLSSNKFRASGWISSKDYQTLDELLKAPHTPSIYRWQLSVYNSKHKETQGLQQQNPAPQMTAPQAMTPYGYPYAYQYGYPTQYGYPFMPQGAPQPVDYSAQSGQYGHQQQYPYNPQVYRQFQQNMYSRHQKPRQPFSAPNQSAPLLQRPESNTSYRYPGQNLDYPNGPQPQVPRAQQNAVAPAVATSQPVQNAPINAQTQGTTPPQSQNSIDVERIKKMSKDDQREEVGEIIYNRANELYHDSESASRIAGMLLEFDFDQLEPILKNEQLLQQNIEEAKKVLDGQQQ